MLKTIAKLQSENNTEEEISTKIAAKYSQLHMNYPSLYNVVLEKKDKFEMRRLDEMFELMNSIDNKKISHTQASEHIGTNYYNEFAKPFVDEKLEKQ
jgi:hypothetical protein